MRDARQVFWGIIIALASIALLFGVFSLSLSEGNMRLLTPTLSLTPTPPPIPTLSQTPTPLRTPTPPPIIVLTWQPSPTLVDSPTPRPSTWIPALPPAPTNCPPPAGWLPYAVQPGDTLDGLALRYKKTGAEISQANCLGTTMLPGQLVYLPPPPTQARVRCGAPRTWIIYIVQQGDTLYHLGQVYGIPYTDIQRANCLASSNIHTGQALYVPPWATHTPSPTIPGLLPLPTNTPIPILFFDIPTDTCTDTPAATDSAAPTETSTPMDPTPIPTAIS